MLVYYSGDTDPTVKAELGKCIDWLENRLNLSEFFNVDLDLSLVTDLDADGYTAGDSDIIYMELLSCDLQKMIYTLCHEMVHVKQILEGRPLEEGEAYYLEEKLFKEYSSYVWIERRFNTTNCDCCSGNSLLV
jgi:hypothetical protein